MASDDSDREEVDRLVQELAAPPKPVPAAQSAITRSATTPEPGGPGGLTPGRRWSTARLLMPAERTEPRKPFPLPAAISLPSLPALPQMPALAFAAPDLHSNTVWARVFVAFGVLLAAAMPYWPYANAWSWGLLSYLSAVLLVVVTGIWGAKLTWDERLPAAHTVAVGTVLWGLGLLAAEAVPRIV